VSNSNSNQPIDSFSLKNDTSPSNPSNSKVKLKNKVRSKKTASKKNKVRSKKKSKTDISKKSDKDFFQKANTAMSGYTGSQFAQFIAEENDCSETGVIIAGGLGTSAGRMVDNMISSSTSKKSVGIDIVAGFGGIGGEKLGGKIGRDCFAKKGDEEFGEKVGEVVGSVAGQMITESIVEAVCIVM
jgi:hypothetical protein